MFSIAIRHNRFTKHRYYHQFDKTQPYGDLRKMGITPFAVHTGTLLTTTLSWTNTVLQIAGIVFGIWNCHRKLRILCGVLSVTAYQRGSNFIVAVSNAPWAVLSVQIRMKTSAIYFSNAVKASAAGNAQVCGMLFCKLFNHLRLLWRLFSQFCSNLTVTKSKFLESPYGASGNIETIEFGTMRKKRFKTFVTVLEHYSQVGRTRRLFDMSNQIIQQPLRVCIGRNQAQDVINAMWMLLFPTLSTKSKSVFVLEMKRDFLSLRRHNSLHRLSTLI